jgi:AcrR family transcriptional regulator
MSQKPSANPPGRPKGFCVDTALDAATRLFAAKGYEGASLSDLTAAMGINRFSLYATFGNKEALFVKARSRYAQIVGRRREEALGASTAREGLERLLREGAAMFTDPAGLGVCFVTQGPLNAPEVSDETKQLLVENRAAVEKAIRRRLDQALGDGELPADTDTRKLARFFCVVIQGMALQAQHGATNDELVEVLEAAMQGWPGHRQAPSVKPPTRRGRSGVA